MLTETSMPRPRRDRGFTVVELLVVMVVLGVIGTVVTSAVISSLQASSSVEDRMRAINDLQSGVERVGRELRAATSLSPHLDEDPGTGISAVVHRDGDRWQFDYYLDEHDDGSTALFEDVTRFDGHSDEVLESRDGIFITDIANLETGSPVFEYFNLDAGVLIPIDCDDNPSRCATAKQVQLTLEKKLPDQDPIAIEMVVNVRNMRYDLYGSGD